MNAPHVPSLRSHLLALLALLLLLALTTWLGVLPLGRFNLALGLAISVAKTLVVMAVFMRLRHGHPLLRILAGLGFAWLALLVGITLADYFTRVGVPAPWP
ncbi:cytochrome C oxidase subunit IV family protein [Fulvimonas sp. R45]|uniref:cytochrome C oxidase subunit IV family protein n=1 Tax=Fulvimonas sp. R45 TaxID=3045937 RepID=UPI00265F5F68|nr:cytochrome C oxidase subunit IV family protein [Fulvimonas sp. R45]MDO1527202.1 cytochrome C oxidase subunit IV family protein [Fulvimonas sp. R45]